tara:strand:- start:18579 stop:18842 length:264 start_codon:yes stop_codon:yes gene_type:complete
MQPLSAIVIFIVIWWTVIFCVLPYGLSTTLEEPEEGEDYIAPGAPKNVNMKKKLLATTIIAAIIWVIVYLIIQSDVIDFRDITDTME